MIAKKAPNPVDKHVGSRVRMRRMMLAMSQEKLGDALGLTFQQVQKYEKGTNRIGASRLQQISHILQVPVSFFFEGAPTVALGPRADGMGEAPSPAYVSDFLATSDGLALTNGLKLGMTKHQVESVLGVPSYTASNKYVYLFHELRTETVPAENEALEFEINASIELRFSEGKVSYLRATLYEVN